MQRSMGMQIRLPRDRVMGLRQTISEWVRTIKDALDFGPAFPAAMEARRVVFAQESARLQHLLEQTRKAAQEKDELIAKLRAVGAVTGNMVTDGPAYYIKKANTLDGPFCTSCFRRTHEINRIASAPKPKGADGTPADWVQCARCKTPFRSDRISQYLNPCVGTRPEDEGYKTEDEGQKTEDRSQKAEDTGQKTEPQAPPASVVRPPSADQEPKPTLVQTPVSLEEDDTPKPVTTARKPPRDPAPPSQRSAAGSPTERDELRLEKVPTNETEPEGKGSPTQDSALQAPSTRRTRSRTRKPRSDRSGQTKATGLPNRSGDS